MNKLTFLLLCKKNCNIDQTIQPLLRFNGEIIVGSFQTVTKKYKNIKLHCKNDYSKNKNQLIAEAKTDWLMFIEPEEMILQGHEQIANKINSTPASYQVSILQGNIITKQIRLWHQTKNLQFINPVYETVQDATAIDLPVYICSSGEMPNLELVNEWCEKMPLAKEPIYYKACTLLLQNKWEDFLLAAQQYMFRERTTKMSLIMLKYYYATVLCYIKNDYQKALEHLLYSLAEKPTMAEFWCLLGDIYYATNHYEKASIFYDNAILLGSRRLKNDSWPYEIKKYKEYPSHMKQECLKMLNQIKSYASHPLK
jgi:tetratricopeptide (TPR) repeat protein